MPEPLRIGVVSYINSYPLTYALETGRLKGEYSCYVAPPTSLNRLLREGELDVALVSSVEYLRRDDYIRVEGVGLASPGEVQSVRLFSKRPWDDLTGRKIGVTSASATSRALLKLLIPGATVKDLPLSHEANALQDDRYAAVLLIGDRALGEVEGARYVYDLALRWKQITGYPMVFALWVIGPRGRQYGPEGVKTIGNLLERALKWGEDNMHHLIQVAARRTGLSEEKVAGYYAALRYRMDDSMERGLAEFYRRLQESEVWENATSLISASV